MATGLSRRKCLAIVLMLVVFACGSRSATSSGASSARSLTPSAQSTPTISKPKGPQAGVNTPEIGHLPAAGELRFQPASVACNGEVGNNDPVAVVVMHGETHSVLRDYADSDHPRTFCTFPEGTDVTEILDPHHVVWRDSIGLFLLELPSGRAFQLFSGLGVAVAPDLSEMLMLSGFSELHAYWDTSDNLIQTYPEAVLSGNGCLVSTRSGAFLRNSKYGFAIWTRGTPTETFLNVVSNHERVFAMAPPSGGWGPQESLSAALWSPVADKLYFDHLGGIWTWTPAAGASQLRPGLSWSFPAMSADGKHIAYGHSAPSSTYPTVHLMDPETGADQGQIGAGQRVAPVFLNSDLIWMKMAIGDGSPESPGCRMSTPPSYIYDLRNKTEAPSILDWVGATWPATSTLGRGG